MYLGTHCSIGSKRVCWPLASGQTAGVPDIFPSASSGVTNNVSPDNSLMPSVMYKTYLPAHDNLSPTVMIYPRHRRVRSIAAPAKRTTDLLLYQTETRNSSGDEISERQWQLWDIAYNSICPPYRRSILLPLWRVTPPPDGGVSPGTIFVRFYTEVKGWRRNIAESFNPLSRAHVRYRRQTDLR